MIVSRLRELFRQIKHYSTEDRSIDPENHHFTAHRGLSGQYPENTVQAFLAASGERFKAIETDIWEVPDFYDKSGGELGFIIMHNADLSGMCGAKVPVRALSSAVISDYLITKGKGNRDDTDYRIPTLFDFLVIMKTNDKELIIEIKDSDISHEGAQKLIRLLEREGLAPRTVLGSFHRKSLATLMSITDENDGFRFLKFIGARDRAKIEDEIGWSADNGIDIISIKSSLLTKKIYDRIRSCGMLIEVWVVNDRAEAADLIRRGIDRITTNEVLW